MDKDEKYKAILKIIELYRNQEALWNIHSSSYRRKDLKEMAWNTIATELQWPESSIKRKIRLLRKTYIIEKKKMSRSMKAGGDTQATYESDIPWINSLHFLDSTIVWRKPISNMRTIMNSKKSSDATLNNDSSCFVNMEPELREIYSKTLFHDLKETSDTNYEDIDTTCEESSTLENKSRVREVKPVVSIYPVQMPSLQPKVKIAQPDYGTTYKIYRIEDASPRPPKSPHSVNRAACLSDKRSDIEATSKTTKEDNRRHEKKDAHKKCDREKEVNEAFNLFGEGIATQLKQLPPDQAYPAMAEIQQILVNKKLISLRKRKISHNVSTQTQVPSTPVQKRPHTNLTSHGTASAPIRSGT